MDHSPIYNTDLILIVGINIASQQSVLWSEILDRLSGTNPPKLILIEPRVAFTVAKPNLHLALRPDSFVPVMNGVLNLVIRAGYINEEYIQKYTTGFEALVKAVSGFTPKRVQEISGVPVKILMNAAQMLGTTRTLVSTVLEGTFQSMEATNAAVNNLHQIRGFTDNKGCGIYKMKGWSTTLDTGKPVHIADRF